MNYDDWLVYMEHKYRGWDAEHICPMCDAPVERSGDYCSSTCFEADML